MIDKLSRAPWLVAASVALVMSGCGVGPTVAAVLLGNSGGSGGGGGGTVVIFTEDADLFVSRGPQDLGDTREGAGRDVVAAQFRLTTTQDASLNGLTVEASGTGDDALINGAQLYIDVDQDGILSAMDTPLGSEQVFGVDDGVMSFEDLGLDMVANTPVDVLVVLETPSSAQEDDTFRIALRGPEDVDATVTIDDEPVRIAVFGTPLNGGTKTISSTGSLSIRPGPNPPISRAVFPNAQNQAVSQFELRPSSVEDVRVDAIRFTLAGSMDDPVDLAGLSLYEDVDSDGELDLGTDVALATGLTATVDNGQVSASGLNAVLPAGRITRWLVVLDLAGTAANGTTVRADLQAAADVDAVGVLSAVAIAPAGLPLSASAALTANRTSLSVRATALNLGGDARPTEADVEALHVRVSVGAAEGVRVDALGILGQGTGDDAADLDAVRVYVDTNEDGALDAGDTLIGQTAFPTDGGVASITSAGRLLAPETVETWLVVYDVGASATGAETFRAQLDLASFQLTGQDSGIAISAVAPAGPPQGGTLTITGGLAFEAGPFNPPAQMPFADANGLPVLQLDLGATLGESVTVTALTLESSGTADETRAIDSVDLYADSNRDGAVDMGDVLLGSQAYAANDAPITFSNSAGLLPASIAPTSTVTLLVVYQLSGEGEQGQTLNVTVRQPSLIGVGDLTGRVLDVSGADVSGGEVTLQRGDVALSAGGQNPPTMEVVAGASDQSVLQLGVAVGPGEAVRLDEVRLDSAGTANDALVVDEARLYLEGVGGTPGAVDGMDTLLGTAAFGIDDGELTFSGAPLAVLPAGFTGTLLVAYDLAAGGGIGTFTARAAELRGEGVGSGLPATVRNLPLSGGTLTVLRGTLSLGIGPNDPGAIEVFPGDTNRVLAQLTFMASLAEGLRIGAITVQSSGSTDESLTLDALRLVDDLNGDGVVSAGDPVLGSLTHASDDQALTYTIAPGALDLIGGQTKTLLLVADIDPTATSGETLRFLVANTNVQSVGVVSGEPSLVLNQALSNEQLLVLGDITLSTPAGAPVSRDVLANADSAVVQQLRLSAGSAETLALERVRITHAGGGDPQVHLAGARLFLDQNANGALDADLFLDDATFAGGVATFDIAAGAVTIPASSSRDLLLVYDFDPAASAPDGADFTPRLANQAALEVRGTISNLLVPVATTPFDGPTLTVDRAELDLAAGTQQPGPSGILQNHVGFVAAQLALDNDMAERIRVDTLQLTAAGTANAQTAITRVRLFLEVEPADGSITGDQLIHTHTGGFLAGNTLPITLDPADLQLDPDTTGHLLIVVDVDPLNVTPGETFSVALNAGDLAATGLSSQLAVDVAGSLPATTHTIQQATLDLANGGNPPSAANVSPTQRDLIVLQAQLTATPLEGAEVQTLRITALGTGTASTGVLSAKLFLDADADGLLAQDILLDDTTFVGNTATFTLAPGQLIVPANSSRTVLVTYDLGGSADTGQTFGCQIAANTDLTCTGRRDGLAGVLQGAPLTGPLQTVVARNLTLAAGQTLPDPVAFNTASDVRVLHTRLQGDPNEDMRVIALRLQGDPMGTGDDTDIRARLFLDLNDDAVADPTDILLGDGLFPADAGILNFGVSGNLDIPMAGSASLLILYDLPGSAIAGETFRPLLTGVDAIGLVTGTPAAVAGAPFAGRQLTVQSTDVTLDQPLALPAAQIFPNATGRAVLTCRLTAGALEGARISSLDLAPSAASTGDHTAATATLILDGNGDGAFQPALDTVLASAPADNAPYTLSGFSADIPAGDSIRLLVLYTLDESNLPGEVLGVQLDAATLVARGLSSNASINDLLGAPVSGPALTVGLARVDVALGANSPAASNLPRDVGGVLAQWRLDAGPAEDTDIRALDITPAGDLDDAADLTEVRLFLDQNDNGLIDAGDSLLTSGAFSADDTTTTFTFPPNTLLLTASTGVHLLLAVDAAAPPGRTVQVTLDAVDARGVDSGLVADTNGLPAAAATHTFVEPELTLAAGSNPPPGGLRLRNDGEVRALHLNLSTGPAEDVRLVSLTVAPSGTLDDRNGIRALDIHADLDHDGALDSGEPLLSSGAFGLDETPQVFSFPAGVADIAASSSLSLLLILDLDGVDGDTLTLTVTPADVLARGTVSGLQVTTMGSPQSSPGFTLVEPEVTLGSGAAPPPARTVVSGVTGAPALQFALTAGSAEALRVDQISLTPSGNLVDDMDLGRIRLYRDANANGVVDAGDLLLTERTGFAGDDALTPFPIPAGLLDLPASGSATILVTVDIVGGVASDTFQLQVDPPSLRVLGQGSGLLAESLGAAVNGGQLDLGQGGLTLAPGSNQPATRGVLRSATGEANLQFQLSANGVEDIRVQSLGFLPSGNGDDANDLARLRLYRDLDQDGALDPDDVLVVQAPGGFPGDDMRRVIAIPGGLTIPAGGSVTLLLLYDFNGTGAAPREYQVSITTSDVASVGLDSSQPITVSGVQVDGANVFSQEGSLTLGAGPFNPGGGLPVLPNDDARVVLQAQLDVGSVEDVRIEQVRLTPSGTLDDATELREVSLYWDQDGDGALSGDPLLVSVPAFSLNDTAQLFTIPPGRFDLPAGSTAQLMVVCSFQGDDFDDLFLQIAPMDVFGVGLESGLAIPVGGGPLLNGPVFLERGGLAVDPGPTGIFDNGPFPNDVDVPALQFDLTAGPQEGVRITQLTLQPSGMLDDGTIAAFRLVEDLNDNGMNDAEPVLATGTFSGDDAARVVTFAAGVLDLLPSEVRTVLVVVDFGGGKDGEDVSLAVDPAGGVLAVGVESGLPISPMGSPLFGPALTLQRPDLEVQLGTNSPPSFAGVFPNGAAVSFAQLQLDAGAAEGIQVDRLVVDWFGTGDEATSLDQVAVYRDVNGDGLLDVGDTLLAGPIDPPVNDARVNLDLPPLTIAATSSATLLITGAVGSTAADGDDFTPSLVEVVAAGTVSGLAPDLASLPLVGATRFAQRTNAFVVTPPTNPADLERPRAGTDIPVLALRLSPGSAEDQLPTGLRLTPDGTVDEGLAITSVRVIHDVNQDGVPDMGEPILGMATFPGDDAPVTVPLSGLTVMQFFPVDFLVVVDLDGAQTSAGQTVRVRLATPTDLTLTGADSGLPIVPTGDSVRGGTATLVEPTLVVGAGPNPPLAREEWINATEVTALLVTARAGPSEGVEIGQVRILPSGTGDDAADISAVRLYHDVDFSGGFSVGDVELASGTFPGDDMPLDLVLLTPHTVFAGGQDQLVVTYDFAANVAQNGLTFRATLSAPGSDVLAAGAVSGLTAAVSGAKQDGAEVTSVIEELQGLVGPAAFGVTPLTNALNAPTLAFELSASPAGSVDLTSIAVVTSGTLDDGAELSLLTLWLDTDNNGLPDSQLDMQVPGGNDATVVFGLGGLPVGAGETLRFFVLADFNGDVGDTFQALLDPGAVVAVGAGSTLSLGVSGAPFAGPTLTLARAGVQVLAGPAPPVGGDVRLSASDVGALQLRFVAGAAEGVQLDAVTLDALGGADETLGPTVLTIYEDLDRDGRLDLGEPMLNQQAYASNDESLTLGLGGLPVPAGGDLVLLATLTFTNDPPDASDYRLRLTGPANVMATGATSGQPAAVDVPVALTGPLVRVRRPQLNAGLGPNNPGATTILATQRGVPVLQFQVTALGAEPVLLDNVVLTASGTFGNDATEITEIRFYEDLDADGMVDPQEAVVGQHFGGFPMDNGTQGVPTLLQFEPGESRTILVVIDVEMASSFSDFQISVADTSTDIQGSGFDSSAAAEIGGAVALTGGLKSVQFPLLAVQNGPSVLPDPTVFAVGASKVPALQFGVRNNGSESIRVSALTVTPNGTGDDGVDLTALELYVDNNPFGVLDASDVLLQAAPGYPGDDTPFVFAIPPGKLDLTPAQAQLLLVVHSYGAPLPGATFQVAGPDSAAEAVAIGLNSGATAEVSASNPVGPIHRSDRPAVDLIDNFASASTPAPLDSNVVGLAFQLNESTGTADAILQGLSVQAITTFDRVAGITAVRLWEDTNGDAVLDVGDVQLGLSGFVSSGPATFAGLNQTLPMGTGTDFLVTLDFGDAPDVNDLDSISLEVYLTEFDVRTTGGVPLPLAGSDVFGPNLQVDSNAPQANVFSFLPTPMTVSPGSTDTVGAGLVLSEMSGNGGYRFQSVTVEATGDADDTQLEVALYEDVNMDFAVDAGDVLLSTGRFVRDDGRLVLSAGDLLVSASGFEQFMLVVNVDPGDLTGGTVLLTIPEVELLGDASMLPIDDNLLMPIVGAPITILASRIQTVAGDGAAGSAGDGGLAANAQLDTPAGVAVDSQGRIYLADAQNHAVRRIGLDGRIERVLGTGTSGAGVLGAAPLAFALDTPQSVVVDGNDDILVTDSLNHRVLRLKVRTGVVELIAGNGTPGAGGDGGRAVTASIQAPIDLALDAAGNLFICDPVNGLVRRVDVLTGVIETVAGGGAVTPGTASIPGTQALLGMPSSVAVGPDGDLFIALRSDQLVVRQDAWTRDLRVVVGGGTMTEDGALAIEALLNDPLSVAVDARGDLFVGDLDGVALVPARSQRIRRVAGGGAGVGEGTPATDFEAQGRGLALDRAGRLLVATGAQQRLRRVSDLRPLEVVAPEEVFAPQGLRLRLEIPAVGGRGAGFQWRIAQGTLPSGLTIQPNRTPATVLEGIPGAPGVFGVVLEVTDGAGRVATKRLSLQVLGPRVDVVAGDGSASFGGDHEPAEAASLSAPEVVARGPDGALWVADADNFRVRRIDPVSGRIDTRIGSGMSGSAGDGGPALEADLSRVRGLLVDPRGDVIVADTNNNRVRRVEARTGVIDVVAGDGSPGYSGEDVVAMGASIGGPAGITRDGAGGLWITEPGNHRVRHLPALTGLLRTAVGDGADVDGADGAPGRLTSIREPLGVTVAPDGSQIVADAVANRIRRAAAVSQTVTTLAGDGTPGSTSDAMPPGALDTPFGVLADPARVLFFTEANNNLLRWLDLDQNLVFTLLGDGTTGPPVEGALASASGMNQPGQPLRAPDGDLVLPIRLNHLLVRLGALRLHTVALPAAPLGVEYQVPLRSTGGAGQGALLLTVVNGALPPGILLSPSGDALFGEPTTPGTYPFRLRLEDGAGGLVERDYTIRVGDPIATSLAGDGSETQDGLPLARTLLDVPSSVALDARGRLLVADQGQHVIRRVDLASGTAVVIAGQFAPGPTGDTGPAIAAELNDPTDLAVGPDGSIYVADRLNHRIRRIRPDGIIETVAGTGSQGFTPDGTAATASDLDSPAGVAVDLAGIVYFSDTGNLRLRRIAPDGTLETVVGDGVPGDGPDGPAGAARLTDPRGLAVDDVGRVFVTDSGTHKVYVFDPAGPSLGTVAGTGSPGGGGDGGPPGLAELNGPVDVALTPSGGLVVAEEFGHRVRWVDTFNDVIVTVGGTGAAGFDGDGRVGVLTRLSGPSGVVALPDGSILVTEDTGRRVRRLLP